MLVDRIIINEMESEYFPSYLVVLILSGLENETKIVFLGYIEIGG